MTDYSDERTTRIRRTILFVPAAAPRVHDLQAIAETMTAQPADVLALLALRDVDVIVLEGDADDARVQALLADATAARPAAVCLLLAGDGSPRAWADAAGVTVLPAAVDAHTLRAACAMALRCAAAGRATGDLQHTNLRLRGLNPDGSLPGLDELGPVERYETLITRSPAMARVLGALRRIEASDSPLLIAGEVGTERGAVAEAIHARSRRRSRPFVALRLGGLPEARRDAELFGTTDTLGAFLEADGGTLFLDDVADASPALQGTLLRALEDAAVTPVGTDRARRVDVRILSGTARNLGDLVEQGLFRRDLYERLHAAAIDLPPLRDRPEDVFLLARHFLALASLAMGRKPPGISREARAVLEGYPWPANVRELRNLVERAAMVCRGGLVIAADLPIGWSPTASTTTDDASNTTIAIPPTGTTLKQLEREIFVKTLALAGGNQSRAAHILGLCESTFRFRLHKLGIASRRTPPRASQPAAAPPPLAARG